MKYLSVILLAFCSCQNVTKGTTELPQTEIKLTEKTFNFGKMDLKDSLNHDFLLVNVGDNPLLISKVGASCGCTSPKWEKGMVNVGDTTEIQITFKPTASGFMDKSIVIEANTDPVYTVLRLQGEVSKH